jgi:hypothetical protein
MTYMYSSTHQNKIGANDMWASLPSDLLVEILRRLVAASAVVRCAGVCKPWRRAVIANASCLRPYSDCFNPNLLLGFFHRHWLDGRHVARLQYVPGPFEDVLASDVAVPRDTTTTVPYDEPLSSRDGFLLLRGSAAGDHLCLCNPLTGSCSFVPEPATTFDTIRPCRYMLVTGDDVRILAVSQVGGSYYCSNGGITSMTYQIFSSASGEWGPLRRLLLATMVKNHQVVHPHLCDGVKDVVVGGDSVVYWLIELIAGDVNDNDGRYSRCVVAMDVRNGRTWAVQLPEMLTAPELCISYSMIALATSEDGRLSVVVQLPSQKMDVWVLTGGDDSRRQWMLRRTIDVPDLLPISYCPQLGHIRTLRESEGLPCVCGARQMR